MGIVKTNSQYYMDIAAAIRSKGGSGTYKPGQMAAAILALEGGTSGSTIAVYAEAGSNISLVCGEEVRTTGESGGVWLFPGCEPGSYQVVAEKGDYQRTYPLEILEETQMLRYEVHVTYQNIYGISRDITASSPAWERTDQAVGLEATASVGTVAGSSGFDTMYPWCDIRRETLSTGDIMVHIPKFWYRRYREGNVEHIQISDLGGGGFKLHPAFCHGGVERDCLYVGAYKTSSGAKSLPNVMPQGTTTRNNFRIQAKNKGAGWGILDLSALSAIQMLYLVEFANFNSQGVIGRGIVDMVNNGSVTKTGTTDTVANLTGQTAGTDGTVDVVYRGLEGLWGNIFELLDGIHANCTEHLYYVCNDPDSYGETTTEAYHPLSFPIAAYGSSLQYVTRLGLEEGERDYIMLPAEASGGSASTYTCDTVSSAASNTTVMKYGGRWWSESSGGLFNADCTNAAGNAYAHSGSRLIYIPQE